LGLYSASTPSLTYSYFVISGAYSDGTLMETLQEMQKDTKDMKTILSPKKTRHECGASAITSNCRAALFKCGQWSITRKQGFLCSFNNEEKSRTIVSLIKSYAAVMVGFHQANMSSEKAYVQPAVRDMLWPTLREQLSCGAKILLENERKFKLHVENDRDEADVVGFTDHCVKIVDSDARLLPLEDKAICKQWTLQDVAQCQAEMFVELGELEEFFAVVPTEYCGILQNGCHWTFIFRTVSCGRVVWSYVRTPATFENGAVSEEACSVVARFLEHVLVIVDRLYDDITLPKMVIRSMTLTSIPEEKEDDGDGKHDGAMDPDGGPGDVPVPLGPRGAGRSSSRTNASKTKKNSGPNTNKLSMEVADKENLFLPFTISNVSKLPIQSVRVFY